MVEDAPIPDQQVVVLDTCAWLWLAEGNKRFGTASCRAAVEAAGHGGRLYLAPISMWEVAMKVSHGKLVLAYPTLEWISLSKKLARIIDAPMTADVVVDSVNLPGSFHQDPADRLIVATARHLGACLVTGDQAIVNYAANGFVKVWKV